MLKTESYIDQNRRWPAKGQHILAQFDDHGVVVYQAYRPAIGRFAAEHNYFGGEFKLARMSWIKPNFLWMMYRCGWGMKPDQEVVLAITLRLEAFDSILEKAVHSAFTAGSYKSHDDWRMRLEDSSVRLQWDPDHDPYGTKQERRAIQLGLSDDVLRFYSRDWILKIEDVSAFVACEREHVSRRELGKLITPREEVYPIRDTAVAHHLGVTALQMSASNGDQRHE